jgi:hypothetical protein
MIEIKEFMESDIKLLVKLIKEITSGKILKYFRILYKNILKSILWKLEN